MNNEKRHTLYSVYEFPECESIVVSGDIHGDFDLLVNKMCVQYQMRNTLLIVAGDCGFGFEDKAYYKNIVKRNTKRMSDANNWIVFVRGNHDDPAYFDGKAFKHKRFIAVPDYSVVKACGRSILCIGGAISVDRQYRREEPNCYWASEAPIYDEQSLTQITSEHLIDTVVTHTAPSFCELQGKSGIIIWTLGDESLLDDVQNERSQMDAIYEKLKSTAQPLSNWYYGHFHQSWNSSIDGVLFKMLDIMEFSEISPKSVV